MQSAVNVLIEHNKIIYLDNAVMHSIPYIHSFTETRCDFTRSGSVQLWVAPELCRQTVLSDVSSEEQVFNRLFNDMLIRKPQLYDICFQSDGSAVVLWFDFEKDAVDEWCAVNRAKLAGMDSVLNGFSFLCPDNGAVVFDFDDYLGIMKSKGGIFTELFSVSNNDNAFSEALSFLSGESCCIYTKSVIDSIQVISDFMHGGRQYDVSHWRRFLLENIL